jgi:hypothetical protein
MTQEQIEKGNELFEIKKVTEKAIIEIDNLLAKQRPLNKREKRYFDDGVYWLSISEHKDGSGVKADLCRYQGNWELLNVIKTELERQLKSVVEQIEEL